MAAKMNNNRREQRLGKRVIKGVAFEIIIILAGAMLLGILISKEMVTENHIGFLSAIILFFASFAGTRLASRSQQNEKIVFCLLSAIVLIVLLIMGTIVFFDCKYGKIGLTLGGIVAGTLVSFVLSCRKGRQQYSTMKNKRRLYKMHNG